MGNRIPSRNSGSSESWGSIELLKRKGDSLEARVVSDSDIRRIPRRPSKRAVLLQRIGHYVFGSAMVLVCLLFIAKSINPPDSELVTHQMAPMLGIYDGLWVGHEVRADLSGQKIAEFDSTWEFWSSSTNVQSLTIQRRIDEKLSENAQYVNLIRETIPNAPSVLRSRLTTATESNESWLGSMLDNVLVWHQMTESGVRTRRYWLTANELHTEEVFVPFDDPSSGWQMFGSFSRNVSAQR